LFAINGRCLPKTKFRWNNEEASFGVNGKQWQANLGGNSNWKNRPTHGNGESSMLIDINGDGLPDRVFDRNPEVDDQPGLFVYLNTGSVFGFLSNTRSGKPSPLMSINMTTSQGCLSILIQAMALITASNGNLA
jgi:hypothetical protein